MTTKTGNPFLDQDFSDVFDFSKYAQQFQVPGVDTKALVEAQRKNVEAMTQANRIAFEGAQAVAQRQADIMRDAMSEAADAMQRLNGAGAPEDRVAKQTEIAKHAFDTALKNIRELAEMTQKSNNEAMDLINKRVASSFDEMRETMQAAATQAQKATTGNGAAATGSTPAKK